MRIDSSAPDSSLRKLAATALAAYAHRDPPSSVATAAPSSAMPAPTALPPAAISSPTSQPGPFRPTTSYNGGASLVSSGPAQTFSHASSGSIVDWSHRTQHHSSILNYPSAGNSITSMTVTGSLANPGSNNTPLFAPSSSVARQVGPITTSYSGAVGTPAAISQAVQAIRRQTQMGSLEALERPALCRLKH